MPTVLSLVRLGTVSYAEGLARQAFFTQLVKQSIVEERPRHFLLLLEHTPVYTVGIRSSTVTSSEEARLRALGADFHRTSRGGLITFHGPGQLVAYPIVSVKHLREGGVGRVLGARSYVHKLEESIIRTNADLNVKSERVEGLPGVWVVPSSTTSSTHSSGEEGGPQRDHRGRRKVASLGVSLQHGISGHGLALNCDNDLEWFRQIVACGIDGVEVTTLSRERAAPTPVSTVTPLLVKHFCEVFAVQPQEYRSE